MTTNVKIGIVIPIRNESENIIQLINEIKDALKDTIDYQIIVVDDNSLDDSVQRIEDSFAGHNIVILGLNRNSGQSLALECGITYLLGKAEVVVTMDGDGQDNPYEIVKLIKPIVEDDYDMVVGWRSTRSDSWVKKNSSRLANKIISLIFGIQIHDQGSPLKAFRLDIYEKIPKIVDQHRYLPLLAWIVGADVIEMPVLHRHRKFGKSKYGFLKALKVLLDIPYIYILVKMQDHISRFGIGLGLGGVSLSIIVLGVLAIKKIIYEQPILDKVSFFVSLNFLIFSILIIIMTVIFNRRELGKIYKKINL